jgi:hypothetical protein
MVEKETNWATENKKHFKLVVMEDDYFFQSKAGDVLRFAGGGMGKRKFIQTALIDTY